MKKGWPPEVLEAKREQQGNRLSMLAGLAVSSAEVPTFIEARDLGVSQGAFEKFFGSYNGFIMALGLQPNCPGVRATRFMGLLEQVVGPVKREATFPWLRSPRTGRRLRVDAYVPALSLVVEYDDESHERQFFFIRRGILDKFEYRQELDRVKNVEIPAHGLRLIRVSYKEPLELERVRQLVGV